MVRVELVEVVKVVLVWVVKLVCVVVEVKYATSVVVS